MQLTELRTLIDFGMVVLLWLVQRVIYPSFLECSETRIVAWHKAYIKRVGPIIIPMMLLQLPLATWIAWHHPEWSNYLAIVCLAICWAMTFAVSVPLHRKIDEGDTSVETRKHLVATNWPRTILWTAAFVLGVL